VLNPANGLRFDVYERVHLPVDVADIHELEEIELTPQIQVVHQGEQVLLRGNLLLNGMYASQGEARETRVLEHWIPVEITLPLNRVRSLEDIRVEVENFDVDLLSARTLNITGVLSLRGVEVREAEAPSAPPAWVDEPFTVVHQREPEEARQESRSVESDAIPEQNDQSEQREAAESGSAELETVQWTNLAAFQNEAPDQQPSVEPDIRAEAAPESNEPAADSAEPAGEGVSESEAERPTAQAETEVEADGSEQQSEAPIQLLEPPQAIVADALPAQEAEAAKPDLKIALGTKKTGVQPEQSQAMGLSSLLQSNRREQEVRQAAAEQEQAKQQAEAAALASAQGEEIEWKSLFLSRDPNAEAFRKVRMCIVQRDDTLDAIAGRYQLNPREIVLYNRLAQHEVAEGQVLFIP
jgi:stage VI sporulation protein D